VVDWAGGGGEEGETQLYRKATTGTSLYFMDWVIS
jgi:hypothetical protein